MGKPKKLYWVDGQPNPGNYQTPDTPPAYGVFDRMRCVYCRCRLKREPGTFGWGRADYCKKCGRAQPWAEAG